MNTRLRAIRVRKGMLQKDVANYLGITPPAYNHYESGRNEPDLQTLQKIADLFGVTTDDLTGRTKNEEFEEFAGKRILIPILNRVLLDLNGNIIKDIKNYTDIDENLSEKFPKCYAYLQSGNSMAPEINDGDMVIFRPCSAVRSGSVAVVCINGDEGTIKRVDVTDSGLTLTPANPIYKPMTFTADQVKELPIKIVGQVVQVRRNYF